MNTTLRLTAVAAVVLLGVSGCVPTPTGPGVAAQPGTVTAPVATSTTVATTGPGIGSGPQAPANTAVPTPDTGQLAQDAAESLAVKVMTLFARPALDRATWLADLKPVATKAFMTENAQINPKFVGVTTVSSAGNWTMDPANPYTVQVPVTTDGGVFTVELHRTGASAPWLLRYVIVPTLRPNH